MWRTWPYFAFVIEYVRTTGAHNFALAMTPFFGWVGFVRIHGNKIDIRMAEAKKKSY